jgi:hypothetical protein
MWQQWSLHQDEVYQNIPFYEYLKVVLEKKKEKEREEGE